LVALEELPHHRQPEEDRREEVVVGGGGRGLGVVLREAEAAALGDEEGVEAGDGAGVAEAGVVADQRLLPVHQAELPAEALVGEGGVVHLAEGAEEEGAARLQEAVLVRREEPRAEHVAQRALAEEEAAAAELVVELRLRLAAEVVGEQRVVVLDGGLEGHGRGLYGGCAACCLWDARSAR